MDIYIFRIHALANKEKKTDNMISDIDNRLGTDSVDKEVTQRCWHCTLELGEKHIGIPFKYENDIYYTYGHFCTFSCAKSYLDDGNWINKSKYLDYLYGFYYSVGNKGIIYPAPPKEMLKEYGGELDHNNYKMLLDDFNYMIYDSGVLNTSQQQKIFKIDMKSEEKTKVKRTRPLY